MHLPTLFLPARNDADFSIFARRLIAAGATQTVTERHDITPMHDIVTFTREGPGLNSVRGLRLLRPWSRAFRMIHPLRSLHLDSYED
jgi:hypothetical protein